MHWFELMIIKLENSKVIMAEMEEQIPKSILFRESLICFLKILFFSIQNEEHLLNK